jgi:TRAP-type C4-dicarboxylate transport system substrate-binding protein
MKTNSDVRLVLGAAITAAAAAMPASAEITWRAPIWGPLRSSTQPFDWYAKEVAAKTGGQMKIQVVHDKGKPGDAAELLKSGAAEASYFCAQYFADKMPLTMVLDLPMFAPEKTETLGRVALALAEHPAIQAELKPWNAKMFLPVPFPQYQIMGNKRVASIKDLNGLRVRISPEAGKSLQEFGAVVQVKTPAEALAGLKSGELDAAAFPYPVAFGMFNFQSVTKYVTNDISLGAQFCYLAVSLKAWNALPGDVKKAMLAAREPALAQYEATYAREDAETIAAFKQQGLEFVSFNKTDRSRLLAKTIKHWGAWVDEREKQGLKGKEVFEFTQAKIREFSR